MQRIFTEGSATARLGVRDFEIHWISSGFRISEWISGFQSGFLDFKVDFWISKWISGFQSRFLDFKVDFWISKRISGFQSGFLEGFLDFKRISGFHSGFLDFWISVWIPADGVRDFFRDGPLDFYLQIANTPETTPGHYSPSLT